ncbi:hypothetical protein KCTC32516_02227 [Polaribacter huanghezhanensis]|uniref:hypothetical protein n=1 Tax=Polaribacter huanghezhanensis TaxID=1354726 RepID=UPI00264973B0|nr:hypothetical protein [Polaribacter huanghezhanensis]WKD86847.1 hypothetical protein KCTC32516_02227 [Polaribacter huanghezhanensis]
MKKFILLLFFTSSLFSQTDKNNYTQPNKNAIYFEIGGLSLKPFSINYDRMLFTSNTVYFNSTIGFGFDNKESVNDSGYSIPVYFNLTTGLHKNNHFEIGIGAIYSNTKKTNDKERIIYGGVKIGYKYQSKNHLFFKTGLNIFSRFYVIEDFNKNNPFKDLRLIGNIFNLSVGYSF